MSFSEEELNESFRRGMFAGEGKAMRGRPIQAPPAVRKQQAAIPLAGNFAVLNAALVVIAMMVLLSQGWISRLRDWVQAKVS